MYAVLRAKFESSNPKPSDTFNKYLKNVRRELNCDLYAARKAEIVDRARRYDNGRISGVLLGGSSKKLMGGLSSFISLPTALNSPQHPDMVETDPAKVVEITRDYFSDLYQRTPPPDKPKSWMNTPLVVEVRERIAKEPFVWPVAATLEDFRAMLRKGNPRPSPGPDRWEKWCVKNLSDGALLKVLDLHNYLVMNASFPGMVKDTHLTYLHK
ncbi:hypothetical protein C0992_004075 [Termitomyces sp. T32_za158]|nr:hypothetical protein C0992_004075 [Termitomyces sp. T32_za158]